MLLAIGPVTADADCRGASDDRLSEAFLDALYEPLPEIGFRSRVRTLGLNAIGFST
jgi:hypothetical protein